MAKTTKTNAARILDKKGIAYELLSYEVDEQNLGAEHVAELLNIPLEQAFKTLVLRGDKTGILVACVAGDKEINLKKLAALSKNKKVEMVPMKDILGLTGYIRGGVSPLGMKKEYPTFVDESMLTKEKIIVSAGQGGLQLYLKPQNLLQSISGTLGEITE